MKKMLKKIFFIFMITVSCIVLTGCDGIKIGNTIFYFGNYTGPGSEQENPNADETTGEKQPGLIIILGNHANSKKFDLVKDFDPNTGKYKDLINSAVHTVSTDSGYVFEADINVIVNDGNPQKVDLPNDLLQVSTGSLDFEQSDRADMTQSIASYLSDKNNEKLFTANDDNADLLSSLGIAANIIKNNPNITYTVFIYDTGICTSGSLNMVQADHINFVEDEVDDIINGIYDEDICDLDKANVYIPYLLNVSDKQNNCYYEDGEQSYIWNAPELTDKMEKLWSRVVERCNGTAKLISCNKLDSAENMDWTELSDDYPYVPTVTLYKNHPDAEIKPNPLVVDSSLLGFKKNSAKFIHGEDSAKNTIAPFVDTWKKYLEQDESHILYIVGSIAKPKIDSTDKIYDKSQERADEVKKLIMKMDKDIEEKQIVTINAGIKVLKGWRDANEYPGGEWSEENAQKNRVVAIIPNCEDSELCKQMLDVLKECKLID